MEKMQENIDTLEKHLQEYKEKCRKKTEGKSLTFCHNKQYLPNMQNIFLYSCYYLSIVPENQLSMADQQKLQQKVVNLESNLKTNTENMEKKESGKV